MHILFVSRRFYPEVIGGGQISALSIAKATQNKNTTITILTFTNKSYKEEMLWGVRIIRHPLAQAKSFKRFSNMEYMYYKMGQIIDSYIPKLKPDIVHCLNIETIPAFGMFSRYRKIIPFTATINSIMLVDFVGNGVDDRDNITYKLSMWQQFKTIHKAWGQSSSYLRFITPLIFIYSLAHMKLLKISASNAQKLIPISKGMEIALLNHGFNKNKIEVIPNPIESLSINKSIREKKNSKNKKIILFVGRLALNKGVHKGILAMKKISNAVLIIAGKGPDEKKIKEYAQDPSLREKIRFLGYVDYEKTRELYSTADIVILPCWIYEALGRTIMEAASMGVPVIASNVGGIPDVVEDNKTGILLKTKSVDDLARALEKLLNNPTLAHQYGLAGKKKMEKEFSEKRIGNMYRQVFSDIVKNRNLK